MAAIHTGTSREPSERCGGPTTWRQEGEIFGRWAGRRGKNHRCGCGGIMAPTSGTGGGRHTVDEAEAIKEEMT